MKIKRHGETSTDPSNRPVKDPSSSRLRVASYPARHQLRPVGDRIWDKLWEDEVFGRSAQLAYYWLFSLFPLLFLLTALLAYSPLASDLDRWLTGLSKVLPANAYKLVQDTFHEITTQRPGLLSFSILVAIWASSSGMGAIITALNKAFDAPRERPWWRERILAILLTLGLTVFIIAALMLIFFGEYIHDRLAKAYDLGPEFSAIWILAQWPVAILFVLFGVELIYYFAPNVKQKWRLFTPGTIFALLFWLLISFGFRFYVSYFANYNLLYGALGGLMVLMIWFYLMGVAILVGGVINSVVGNDF
jgi:membrane protein